MSHPIPLTPPSLADTYWLMESQQPAASTSIPRDPDWAVRVFAWIVEGPPWRRFVAAMLGAIAAFLLTVMAQVVSASSVLPGWADVLIYSLSLIIPLGFIFYLFLVSVSRIIGHRIIAYVSGPDALRKLSASDLEHLTGEVYRTRGSQVRRRGVMGQPDGGVDLTILRHGKRGIIQCKRWTHENIGVEKLRELYGAMVSEKAEFAIFVTTTDFTEPAEQYAADKPIELVNLGKLWEMVADAKLEEKAKRLAEVPAKLEINERHPLQCPRCGNALLLRQSMHGPFLGCKSYHETGCNTLIPLSRG